MHSEYNHEDVDTTLFQIWILPENTDQPPSWGTRQFPREERSGQLVALASGYDQDAEALPIRTRSRVSGASLKAGQKIIYEFEHANRYGYLVPATGSVSINDIELQTRDGGAISGEKQIEIIALDDAEIVLVDTPALPGQD